MNLRVVGANLVVSIKSFYREKTAMFFTIAFPVILILVFGTIFLKQDHMSYDLQVQDLDQTTESAQLIKVLALNGVFTIAPVDSGADAARYFKDNKLNLLLIIPKGYGEMQARRILRTDGKASSDCPMEISLLAGARQVTTVGRYAMPDYTTTFATLSLDDVLAAME